MGMEGAYACFGFARRADLIWCWVSAQRVIWHCVSIVEAPGVILGHYVPFRGNLSLAEILHHMQMKRLASVRVSSIVMSRCL